MEKGTTITLDEDDQSRCRELAAERFKNNRMNKVRNARIGPQSDEFTDLEGIAGEFAFCRLMGIDPDETVFSRSSKTDKGDAKSDGRVYDVKTTKYSGGKLLARITLSDKTDTFFVLMVGRFPTYKFAGGLEGSELLVEDNIVDLGYGPTYAATQGRLKALT